MLWFQTILLLNVISKCNLYCYTTTLTLIKICCLQTFCNPYLDYIEERGAPESLKIGLNTEVQVHAH